MHYLSNIIIFKSRVQEYINLYVYKYIKCKLSVIPIKQKCDSEFDFKYKSPE